MATDLTNAYRGGVVQGKVPNLAGLAVEQVFSGINYLQRLGVTDSDDVVHSNILPNKASVQPSVDSIFNKFTVFSYSGLNAGLNYEEGGHFIGYPNSLYSGDADRLNANQESTRSALIKKINDQKAKNDSKTSDGKSKNDSLDAEAARINGSSLDANSYIGMQKSIRANPTASNIIKWGAEYSDKTPYGFQPFSYTDFIFCKNYGKIPNNRLITLRRYPFPIEDSVRIGQDRKKSAIPIAQAVTWFGGDTENSLSKLGVFNWDMPWAELTVTQEDNIEGNEILVSDISQLLNGLGGDKAKGLASKFSDFMSTLGEKNDVSSYSGYDKVIQQYQRDLYTKGPYWNRIYGPVNVINSTTHRTRGIQTTNWRHQFKINFHYSFRSFNGLSPKIVALDLISNFLNLTYNDAQFLNQLPRYFAKTGVKLDQSMQQALGNILASWGTTFQGTSIKQLMDAVENWMDMYTAVLDKAKIKPVETIENAAQLFVSSSTKLGGVLPKLLSIKSALSDRAIGEWHLTVGNPMNPIFVMGDLIVTDTKMVWDEEMGPDDFPTGVKFEVTLQQGKPRDKTAIERMLNQGGTKLTYGAMRTSSADDTFGTQNNQLYNEGVLSTSSTEQADAINNAKSDTPIGKYRDRFRQAYGIPVSSNGGVNANKAPTFDDSLLLLYYHRSYQNN